MLLFSMLKKHTSFLGKNTDSMGRRVQQQSPAHLSLQALIKSPANQSAPAFLASAMLGTHPPYHTHSPLTRTQPQDPPLQPASQALLSQSMSAASHISTVPENQRKSCKLAYSLAGLRPAPALATGVLHAVLLRWGVRA